MATTTTTTFELEDQTHEFTPDETSSTTTFARPEDAPRLADAGIPDGGYGYIVLIGCGTLAFWCLGTVYSWGVVQGALVAQGQFQASKLSWVGSLCSAMLSFLAVPAARVLNTLGTPRTGMIGITLLGLGGIVSSFSTDHVVGLFIGTGVIMGIGLSLAFVAVSSLPASYFRRKLGLANGIVFAAGGVGGAVNSFMMDGLIKKVGIAWTFRTIGILTIVTGVPAAYMMKDCIAPNRRSFVDWSLFKDFRFVLIFLAGVVGTFPLLVPPFFLPLYSVSVGLPGAAAALVAGYNLSSAVGRICSGYLCDRIGAINTLFGVLVLVAVSMLALWPVSTTLAPLVVFVIINGAGCGGFFSVSPTVIGQVFGNARVSVAMSMVVTGWTGGYLMGSPIAGYLLAAYGGEAAGFKAYRPAIYYAGTMALGAAGLVAMVRLRMSRHIWEKV